MSAQSHEKLLIIGSGPAALTAAIYAARAGLRPLIIEGREPGGQLMSTTYVENWPGITSIMGPALMQQMHDHALHFDTRFLSQEVVSVTFQERPFGITTHKGMLLTADAVIIATGANPRKLGCPGEDTYWSKGVTSCAVCDGAFYKNKQVIVVGGGDSAMENASFLTNFTDKITIVHILDKLTASVAMQNRVINDRRIKIIYNSTVSQILGSDDHLTQVVITNQKTGEVTTLPTDGLFVSIGLTPNTALFKGQLELDAYGYIVLKNHTQSSIPGVFVAGDVTDSRYRQAITSAGSGCAASLDAERFLHEHQN